MNERLLNEITQFVFIEDTPQKSDIIFIPGSSSPEPGERAAELYNQGFANKILPSGGVSIKTGRFYGVRSKADVYSKQYASEWEFLSDVLKVNGVPEEHVFREDKSGFTKENALLSRKVLDDMCITIQKAILCCRSFHARRAYMFYQFAFPDTEFYICPAPFIDGDVDIRKENWFMTEIGIKRVLGEIRRYGDQFSADFLDMLNNNNYL